MSFPGVEYTAQHFVDPHIAADPQDCIFSVWSYNEKIVLGFPATVVVVVEFIVDVDMVFLLYD